MECAFSTIYNISPIPANNQINVAQSYSDNSYNGSAYFFETFIYDLNGVLIKNASTSTNSLSINIDNLKKGLYIIHVVDKYGITKRQFLKN